MGRYFLVQFVFVFSAAAMPGDTDDWNRLTVSANAKARAGDYAATLELYRQALLIAERFGPGDLRLAASLDALGNTYSMLGMWAESERQFRRALPIIEAVTGPRSVTYGMGLLDLGNMFGNSGRIEKAEAPLREALSILSETLPAGNFNLGIARASYGAVLVSAKRYREAEKMAGVTVASLEADPERACVPLADSYLILGMAAWRDGRTAEAAPPLQKAVDTLQQCFGPDHPMLAQPLNRVAIVDAELHRMDEADAAFRRAIAICEARLSPDHPTYANVLSNYSAFLRRVGKKSEAKKIAERARQATADADRRNGKGMTVDITEFRPGH